MPDTTPATAQPKEAPPSEDGWRPDLTALRARLDEIDDKIHDLLMDRALVVEGVARSGKAAAFRPGREAAILRRLLARHSGKLPARTLVRMWREMLAGTTAMQTAVTVAVFDVGGIGGLAREHFGLLTPVVAHQSVETALRAVRTGEASVAVLPFPTDGVAWWTLLTAVDPRLYIVARLPFWARAGADALVVASVAPDASGADRSFIARHGTIVEVDGMVTDGDPRLPVGAIALGGYAIPVVGEHA